MEMEVTTYHNGFHRYMHMNQQAKEHNTTEHHTRLFNDAPPVTYISVHIYGIVTYLLLLHSCCSFFFSLQELSFFFLLCCSSLC